MKRLAEEPLVHFLVLGALLFAAFDFAGGRASSASGKIVVTQGQIAAITAEFTRTWRRPPIRDELEGLIRDRVREEIYCREAVALGLDKDDAIIRRRLRQKLEFVSEDTGVAREPTDQELRAYFESHTEAFRVEPRFSFRQVYLSAGRHRETMERDAARLRSSLIAAGPKADLSKIGDPLPAPSSLEDAPLTEVRRQFGETFARSLAALPRGRWVGPVASASGVHLVYLGARTEGGIPAFADARDRVLREWMSAQRIEANEAFYDALLAKYTVVVEREGTAESTR